MQRLLALVLLALSGCASLPEDAGGSEGASPSVAYLLNHEEKDDAESISKFSFQVVDGKSLVLPVKLDNGVRAYKCQAGQRKVGIHFNRNKDVGFMQRGLPWVTRDAVDVTLLAGHRYRVSATYLRGEMTYRYRIVDADTGDPVSEEREVFVSPRAPDWSVFFILPIVPR